MAANVAGDMYHDLTGQLHNITTQLRQKNGYPYDPNKLKSALQSVIEGQFMTTVVDRLPVHFDPTISTEVLLAEGNYTEVGEHFTTDVFPKRVRTKESAIVEVLAFNRIVSTPVVLDEFRRRGLERPLEEDILFFGAQHQRWQGGRYNLVFPHEPIQKPKTDKPSFSILYGDWQIPDERWKLANCPYDGAGGWTHVFLFAGILKVSTRHFVAVYKSKGEYYAFHGSTMDGLKFAQQMKDYEFTVDSPTADEATETAIREARFRNIKLVHDLF